MKRPRHGFFGGVIEYFSLILREHAESLLLAVFLALLVRAFVFSTYTARSDSMRPTLLAGELVLGFRVPFGLDLPIFGQLTQGRPPRAGELVVAKCPSGLCLARVVGIPGDRLEMRNQRLIVNQEACRYEARPNSKQELLEQCPTFKGQIHLSADWPAESWGPIVVQPDEVYLLNDNRSDSIDSRRWGAIKSEDVQAQASARWLSLNWGASNGEPWLRWGRSFSRLN